MTYDAKELEQYPEIMNKEQLRKACHISKRTAHYLLKFNLIPHVCTGKKTRCYAIKKRDVIDFMINREVNPSRYIVPTSWYKYGNEDVKPYKIRIQPPLPNDPQKTLLAPGAHSQFGSGKNTQFEPEQRANPFENVFSKTAVFPPPAIAETDL